MVTTVLKIISEYIVSNIHILHTYNYIRTYIYIHMYVYVQLLKNTFIAIM